MALKTYSATYTYQDVENNRTIFIDPSKIHALMIRPYDISSFREETKKVVTQLDIQFPNGLEDQSLFFQKEADALKVAEQIAADMAALPPVTVAPVVSN